MTFDWQDHDAAIRAAVFGSGGGIGQAIIQGLAAHAGVRSVLAYGRRDDFAETEKVSYAILDILDDSALRAAAAATNEPLDLIIVASGTLHSEAYKPERRLKDIDADAMLEVLRINTVAPALIAKHFLPLLDRKRPTVFAALSARVGSIGDNRLGGWVSYRSSKAALNMVLKTLAIEHARTRPSSTILGLHPGTVDTALSEPFSGNVPEGKLFSPAQSAGYLLDVIAGADPADSGSVLAWDGQRIDP